jgi:branched-chain amino acid aminotransferase
LVYQDELKTADEVFITSSFKDIVPVVKIDDFSIGSGGVGSVTKDLMARFAKTINT